MKIANTRVRLLPIPSQHRVLLECGPTASEVYHFSEDPSISEFIPHVAVSAADHRPFVWAVDAERAADYWFPRNWPRAMAWVTPTTTPADRDFVLRPGKHDRVHAVEYGWFDAIAACRLFV